MFHCQRVHEHRGVAVGAEPSVSLFSSLPQELHGQRVRQALQVRTRCSCCCREHCPDRRPLLPLQQGHARHACRVQAASLTSSVSIAGRTNGCAESAEVCMCVYVCFGGVGNRSDEMWYLTFVYPETPVISLVTCVGVTHVWRGKRVFILWPACVEGIDGLIRVTDQMAGVGRVRGLLHYTFLTVWL